MTTSAGLAALCCGAPIPQICLEATCEHGTDPLWNIRTSRWEIPQEGPCGILVSLDQNNYIHTDCRRVLAPERAGQKAA